MPVSLLQMPGMGLGLGLGLRGGWGSRPHNINNNYETTTTLKKKKLLVVASSDDGIGEKKTKRDDNGGSLVVSGTTARGRRLLKVREDKRKREYDRLHNYPAWAKVLEDACKSDEELRALLGDSIGNPELMRQRVEDRVRKKGRSNFHKSKTGSVVSFKVSFRDFNPIDSYIWFEFYGSPSDQDVDIIGTVIQSWYLMGRLGAFNSSNLQLANSSMEYDPLYDADKGFKAMPSSFHDISDVEFQDNWGRVWVDLGTSDFFAIDVLLNCLTVLSSEYLGIQQVVFGGRRIGDWEEGMTNPEYGYNDFGVSVSLPFPCSKTTSPLEDLSSFHGELIGRKSSRVLVTGGEDHKVNLWAIGKPNAILSLSGHTSGIDSVSFDSSEVLVAAGAASGTVKLWDLEEGKIVRTLTGHRSNCISVDFHPFGEFFASGSLDTNLKIWDIRKKGCIHTYKGHTRGVNAIRFTPDGRWVVSGGEDNTVKLWDLTAGKLLHDFKCHEGQIQCIDFHPHEFLLATGSADRTVKFWDLETFELIGSAGPETTGVRCLTFNSDGRTLLCGLHESLKVFSWEPIGCPDSVDVGWSKLSDLNVHEGKLLGCSYNQSCVGVWVVDLVKETKSLERLSDFQNSDHGKEFSKESKVLPTTGSAPGTPQRASLNTGLKATITGPITVPSTAAPKRSSMKVHSAVNVPVLNKADVIPVIVPRTNSRSEQVAGSRKEIDIAARTMPFSLHLKTTDFRKFSNSREDMDQPTTSIQPAETTGCKATELISVTDRNISPAVKGSIHGLTTAEQPFGSGNYKSDSTLEPPTSYQKEYCETRGHKINRDVPSIESQKGGRMRSLMINWEKRGSSPSYEGPTPGISAGTSSVVNVLPFNMRGHAPSIEKEMVSASDEDAIADLMEQHDQFVSSMQSRSAKLQVVYRYWERNDVKGAIGAMEKMADHAVIADVISIVADKIDNVTLDICTCLLPLLTNLLESDMDRHSSISLDMLLKLVRTFGSMIYSALSASTSVGVDIEAEQRLERCNICFVELEKVKRCLLTLTRKGGSVAKYAQELNLALQEVS
ncbi:katanin p80 WD40 repeat-containing subunit B1 [Populus alba x Populus x berolinensis]|uniref:Katanin p80 WD40 repeat-containing subunit B1 homolog n=1 Tax=Populus alba x Populus x berolinensis TaxID=444605 RepID=A0AAD6Q944_9ROSI|nr:katanin p80 WD40 repeat-containing subunit B1 [Populus alba x Populus x berolinensis]